MSDPASTNWSGRRPVVDPETVPRIERAFARCFSGADGETALAHLHAITLDRALGPEASDAAIRYLEGRRALVLHIRALVDRGRTST